MECKEVFVLSKQFKKADTKEQLPDILVGDRTTKETNDKRRAVPAVPAVASLLLIVESTISHIKYTFRS